MSFYSPIDRLAQTLPRPKGTGAEFMTELSKMPGYKAQEAEDRGLQALVNMPKMERAQFMEALKSKPPVVPTARHTQEEHHESYTLPGGSNYREILLQHPKSAERFPGVPQHFGGAPNILASVRAKDRTGPNGEKILHIEELQSDWHQQGREHGYRPAGQPKKLTGEPYKVDEDEYGIKWSDGSIEPDTYSENYANRLAALGKLTGKVPDAPFKKNWHEMALKKMIHHAAKNGYDAIAITPGQEQADRYGLAQRIGVLSYDPERQHFAAFKPNRETAMHEHGATPERVSQLVGKELAQKLMASPRQGGFHYLEGDDIKVGGEGMKGFYDKIVPNFLNQFGKKYGAKVGQGQVNIDDPNGHSQTEMLRASGIPEQNWGQLSYPQTQQMMAEYSAKQPPKMAPVHIFPITPAMREDVTKNGVPLYAKGGEVEVKPTNYDPNLQRKHPELEAAIRGIAAGTTTHKQLDKLIAKHKPIKPYEFVPQPATDEDAERALKPAQKPKWRGHEQWPAGRKVGLRLDIPAYETHGVWVNSVHDEEGKGDDNLKVAYGPVSSVKNAVFDPTPHKAEEVGMGEKGKSSFARIKGDLHHMSEDEAVEHMKTHLNDPDYAQVGFDPRRHGFFYDRKTMKPVTHSAHVVQIGPLVLAHKPTYGKRENYATGGPVPPLRPLSPQLTALREQMAQQSALNKAYDEAMKNVYTNQMPTFAQWLASQGKAKGGKVSRAEHDANLAKFLSESKVKGRMYHGTQSHDDYEEDSGAAIKQFTNLANWVAKEPYTTNTYAGKNGYVMPVHINIKKPLRLGFDLNGHLDDALKTAKRLGVDTSIYSDEMEPYHVVNSPEFIEAAMKRGYDGITAKESGRITHAVFDPRMIKSAIGNRGTYNPNDPDITKAKGGSIKPVGYTKEKITVSPNLDAMRYELESVKHYSKKVK